MYIKKALYLLIISFILLNMDSIYQDTTQYDIDKFSIKQLSQKKWRCIAFYYDKHFYTTNDISKYHKYLEKSCDKYKHDYLNFILEKSNIEFYNILKKITAYVIIIYLYYSMV